MPRTLVMGRLLVAVAVLTGSAIRAQAPKVGERAADFSLAALGGDSARLAGLRGHPVVLKFWATWCPTCRTEMPELVAAQAAQSRAGLRVLAIDAEDPPDRIRRYLASIGVSGELVVLLDPHSHLGDRYHIRKLPTTVFVDSGGIVRAIHDGAIEPAEFASGVRAIIPTLRQE